MKPAHFTLIVLLSCLLAPAQDSGGRLSAAKQLVVLDNLSRLDPQLTVEAILVCVADQDPRVSAKAIQLLSSPAFKSERLSLESRIQRIMAKSDDKAPYARLLARLNSNKAQLMLLKLLVSTTLPDVKLAAIQGLARSGRPDVGKATRRFLRDKEKSVRKAACVTIGHAAHRPAVPDLIALLQEGDQGLVANAHWALRKISGLKLRADPLLWKRWWNHVGSKAASDRESIDTEPVALASQ